MATITTIIQGQVIEHDDDMIVAYDERTSTLVASKISEGINVPNAEHRAALIFAGGQELANQFPLLASGVDEVGEPVEIRELPEEFTSNAVVVSNTTRNEDGTRKRYMLLLPRDIRDTNEALAWIARRDDKQTAWITS